MALREYSVADARKDFAELINLVAYGKEQITISRRGKVVAAVVPIDDLELLNYFMEKIDIPLAEAAKEEADREGWIDWEDYKAGRQLNTSAS